MATAVRMASGSIDEHRDMRWSTHDVTVERGVGDWIEKLSSEITELDLVVSSQEGFTATWSRFGTGPVDLNFLKSTARRVIHTHEMAAREVTPKFDLLYMRSGSMRVSQRGRDVDVAQGQFVLVENSAAWELHFSERCNCLMAHLPEQWLRKWVPHPAMLMAEPFSGQTGWGLPVASLLTTIDDNGLGAVNFSRSVIADQLGTYLGVIAGPTGSISRHQMSLFAQLRRRLVERCYDPDLTPGSLAQDLGISKRHLHGVFARAGFTFGGLLTQTRLNRAAQMLSDRRFSGHSIGDIAWTCGFADPSHFAQRFRERYNASPTEYRKRQPKA